MSFDSNTTVSQLIKNYLKPEFPIYRVLFINSWIDYEDHVDFTDDLTTYDSAILKTKTYSRIMECKPLSFGMKIDLSASGQTIDPNTILEFAEKKIVTEVVHEREHYVIIGTACVVVFFLFFDDFSRAF